MRERKIIALEDYITFLHNPTDQHDLTMRLLNQIIHMHGFKKIYRRPKKDLVDALSSIEVILDPFRSTMKENISSSAPLTKDEVMKDLADLEWQECPLQYIETLTTTTTTNGGDHPPLDELDLNGGYSKPKTKRRNGKKMVLIDVVNTEGTKKWGAKRKRNSITGPNSTLSPTTTTGGGGVAAAAAAAAEDVAVPLSCNWLSL